jgi:hypothetical protein
MHSRYDVQLFYSAVGSLSAFFVAWCGVAIAMLINARRSRASSARQ